MIEKFSLILGLHVDCSLPGNQETEDSEIINGIYLQRTHSLWVTRAKVAYLLRFVTNERIRKTNFDFDKAIDYWNRNKIKIIEQLS